MQTRRLGRTDHHSSLAVLGTAALWDGTPDQAAAALELALERGVNHIDIAPAYGRAEELLGPLLPAVRDRIFLGCKTDRADADGVRAQLDESLEILQTDRFDLYQAHGVTGLDELERRAPGIEAIVEAKDRGLATWVGITGHDLGAPAAHLEAVRRWDLDTVMFPIYPRVWADPQYRADAEELLAECAARDLGVMIIKAAARRPWGDRSPDRTTWYEPWSDAGHVTRGVRFALSTPGVHAFCTPGDLGVLPLALDAAEAYEPLSDHERAAAVEATADDDVIFPLVENAPAR